MSSNLVCFRGGEGLEVESELYLPKFEFGKCGSYRGIRERSNVIPAEVLFIVICLSCPSTFTLFVQGGRREEAMNSVP